MSKRRLKFSKLGMGKYISHLDLLRAFTRAITRAGLPVKYSNGFNPHQIITFSLPLSVGVTSEAEYTDIDFEDDIDNAELMRRLNESLPDDLRIVSVGEPLIAADKICAAEYYIKLCGVNFAEAMLDKFFGQECIYVVKKTKKGEKTVNLKDYILNYKIISVNLPDIEFSVVLSAGGQQNIKPMLLTQKLLEYVKAKEETMTYIHRKEIFYASEKEIKANEKEIKANEKELKIYC